MPQWTHRATWPDDPETRDTDRVVLCGGERIGRVRFAEERYPAEIWQWTGLWSGQAVGSVDTREEALEALRLAYIKACEDEPGLVEEMVSRNRRSDGTKP